MSEQQVVGEQDVERLVARLKKEAEAAGYNLNPDAEFVRELARGLLANEQRYGYQACPCRLASGERESDLDLICPCDYRDPDLDEHGACYCALYVDRDVLAGKKPLASIPERRGAAGAARREARPGGAVMQLAYPVWRCKVCGYLAARDQPPEVCPVCKVKKDRFERFM